MENEEEMNGFYALVDTLQHFGYPEFTDEYLVLFKELPGVISLAKQDFDWGTVPGAKKYNTALQKSMQSAQQQLLMVVVQRIPLIWIWRNNELVRRILASMHDADMGGR